MAKKYFSWFLLVLLLCSFIGSTVVFAADDYTCGGKYKGAASPLTSLKNYDGSEVNLTVPTSTTNSNWINEHFDVGDTSILEGVCTKYLDTQDREYALLVWDGLRYYGYCEQAAAAIMGSMSRECGFKYYSITYWKPEQVVADGTITVGLHQWEGGRYEVYKKFCEGTNYPFMTIKGQIAFLDYEMCADKNTPGDVWWLGRSSFQRAGDDEFKSIDELKSCTDIGRICRVLFLDYGRGKLDVAAIDDRIKYGQEFYNALKGRSNPYDPSYDGSGGDNLIGTAAGVTLDTASMMGVPDEMSLVGIRQIPDYSQGWQDLPDLSRDGLTSDEVRQVDELVSDIETLHQYSLTRFIRALVAGLGIALFFYVLFFFLAWMFDGVNILFDFSFVSIITFGRWRRIPKGIVTHVSDNPQAIFGGLERSGYTAADGTRYLGLTKFVMIELIIIIFASILVNGTLYSWLRSLVLFIQNQIG